MTMMMMILLVMPMEVNYDDDDDDIDQVIVKSNEECLMRMRGRREGLLH